jgi:signal transduction histidine kinase
MFDRARRRLTLLYIGLFSLVLAVFSIGFYLVLAFVLSPAYDVGPDLTNEQAADLAYRSTIEQIGVALLTADLVVIVFVAAAAWLLAARTLRPIREAHERQRRFVADASHEMRSPIAAIRSSAEAALAGSASQDDLREALTVAADASRRLTDVTADLLLLARTDEGLEPRQETFDLSVLVAETLDQDRQARPTDSRRADADLRPGLMVHADQEEVGRIVRNLVDNAFRYGGDDPRVRIRTSSTDGDAVVEVSDAGPGIDASDLERIFEPFYRVTADARAPAGNGLGLAIASRLALRNRARLTVKSRVGHGTTFRLAMPRFR